MIMEKKQKNTNYWALAFLVISLTPVAIGLIGLIGVLILVACPCVLIYFVIKLIIDKLPNFGKPKKIEQKKKTLTKSINSFDFEKIIKNANIQ